MIVPGIAVVALVALGCGGGAGAAAAGALARRRAARRSAACVARAVRGPLGAAQLALHAAARRGEVRPRLLAAVEVELRRALEAVGPGPRAAAVADVLLVDLLRCQVQTWRAVGAAHGVRVVLAPGPGTALTRAEALRVAQATASVVADAIERGGGTVVVRTRAAGDRVRVEVCDGGPGLPASVAELARRAGGRPSARGLAVVADATAPRRGVAILAGEPPAAGDAA